ncbi:MAG: alpha/beta hydrolase [Anaerolineales bacterium]
MEKTKVNGINVAYERRGRGEPLVLIHGYPLDGTTWSEVASLLENDFDLIIPDLRGMGQSDAVDKTYTVADLASDIAGLLDYLKIQKTFIAGHSMGGYVALAFARAYPNRVRGLGMISSQVLADSPERKQGRYKTAKDVEEKGIAVVVDSMSTKLSADARIQAFVRDVMQRQKPAGVIGSLKAMAERPDSSDLFKSFKFPVVIVHGDADALIPVERGREMNTALPSAHYAELKGAGHIPMMENPKEVAERLAVLRFSLESDNKE